MFNANLKDKIKWVRIPYRPGTGTSSVVHSGSQGLNCRLFCLSGYEVGRFIADDNVNIPIDGTKLNYFQTKDKRIATFNGENQKWWIRSPFLYKSGAAVAITSEGNFDGLKQYYPYGYRPALILSKNILVSHVPSPDGSYNIIF